MTKGLGTIGGRLALTAVAASAIWATVSGTNLEDSTIVHLDITAGDTALVYVGNGSTGEIKEVDFDSVVNCEKTVKNCFWSTSLTPEGIQTHRALAAQKAWAVYIDNWDSIEGEPNKSLLKLNSDEVTAESLPFLKSVLPTIAKALAAKANRLAPLDAQDSNEHSDSELQERYEAASKEANLARDVLKTVSLVEGLTDHRANLIEKAQEALSADELPIVLKALGIDPNKLDTIRIPESPSREARAKTTALTHG